MLISEPWKAGEGKPELGRSAIHKDDLICPSRLSIGRNPKVDHIGNRRERRREKHQRSLHSIRVLTLRRTSERIRNGASTTTSRTGSDRRQWQAGCMHIRRVTSAVITGSRILSDAGKSQCRWSWILRRCCLETRCRCWLAKIGNMTNFFW